MGKYLNLVKESLESVSPTIKTFNTRRGYSDEGQVIHWQVHQGATYFVDSSRQIYGKIPTICRHMGDVLGNYDSGNYQYERLPPELNKIAERDFERKRTRQPIWDTANNEYIK